MNQLTDPQWIRSEIQSARTEARLQWLARMVSVAVEEGDGWATSEVVADLRKAWRKRLSEIQGSSS